MMHILKKLNFENLQKVLAQTFMRFPVSFLISGIVFGLFIFRITVDDLPQNLENIWNKGIFTLILTFFFSIGVYLFGESKKLSFKKLWDYQFISVIFGCLFYVFFEENIFQNFSAETAVYITVTLIGILTFVFIAPFILRIIKNNFLQREFYISSYHLIINTLISIIVGISSMLLGFIGLWAIFELFELHFIDEGKIFGYWAVFTLSFFAPIFFLSNFPNAQKINLKERIQDNNFYGFLVKYVGLPAITLYFIILYAYSFKVFLNFSEWPQGKITWMVIGFSFFGYLIYAATYIFEQSFKPAYLFRKFFPFMVLPQVMMLFYAIFLRIAQYDFTINRYLVVSFGIWLLGLSLYYIFSKRKFLGVIFYSLLITTIFISIGPWSVYSFPENRQKINLINYLKQAHILQNYTIIPLEKYEDIDAILSGKIYGSINYLCNFHGCETLENIFSKEISEIKVQHKKKFEENKKENIQNIKNGQKLDKTLKTKRIKNIEKSKYSQIRSWNLQHQLSEKIKVRAYYNREKDNHKVPQYLYFETQNHENYFGNVVKVSGYDYYLYNLYNEDFSPRFSNTTKEKTEIKTMNFLASVDIDRASLTIFHQTGSRKNDRKNIETFDLKDVFAEILNQKENGEKFSNREGFYLKTESLIFELQGKNLDIKVHFNNVSIPNPVWTKEVQVEQEKDKKSNNHKFISIASPRGYTNAQIWIKEK